VDGGFVSRRTRRVAQKEDGGLFPAEPAEGRRVWMVELFPAELEERRRQG